VDEIARAMADLLLDSEMRTRMERLGLRRAAHFNWQNTAQRTLEVFHEVVERPALAVEPVRTSTLARG
jgi:glycosyltransferase involved in cell wall biosynthesis